MRRTHARSVEHPALEKGFIQDSAVSAELAVDFALRQNVEHNYRREAREVDHRRGALSQVAHLDLDYPDIAPHPPLPAAETLLEHFDLATVIKVSEAVSGEIVLGDLIETIAAARFNVCAALNFLDKQPPDLSKVREALGCIIDDANRAGDIIDRIRDHLKKAPPRQDRFDLNEAINEVIELMKCAISDNGVSIQIRLTESITPVQGDRAKPWAVS